MLWLAVPAAALSACVENHTALLLHCQHSWQHDTCIPLVIAQHPILHCASTACWAVTCAGCFVGVCMKAHYADRVGR